MRLLLSLGSISSRPARTLLLTVLQPGSTIIQPAVRRALFSDALIEIRIGRTTNNANGHHDEVHDRGNGEHGVPVARIRLQDVGQGTTNADSPLAV